MKMLLPHVFKRFGLVMMPLGFILWLSMQLGYIKTLLSLAFKEGSVAIHHINILIAILSFFSFLTGIYFLVFSKEKVEDEMIQKIRLDSFQFAALMQLASIILGFLFMLIFEEPYDAGLMLFFIALLFIFWLSFIARFNYLIHFR